MINTVSFTGLGVSLRVSRSAFSVFGMPVYTYGILIALGVCIAFAYATIQIKKTGIRQDDFLNMFIIGLPSAIVGARIYYVIFSWDMYKNDIWEIFNFRGGGLAIYGGVICAAATVLIYCKAKRINKGTVLDVLAVALLIGQAIGRWGNFVNGEAYGSVTSLPWAMTIEQNGRIIAESVHPTFLYESVFNALGIVVLTLYKKKKIFEGEVFCAYMIWYGMGRFLIEGLRADSLMLGALRVSQLLSFALVATGIILIAKNRKKHLTTEQF